MKRRDFLKLSGLLPASKLFPKWLKMDQGRTEEEDKILKPIRYIKIASVDGATKYLKVHAIGEGHASL
jgi:hypothetical protein